MNTSPLSEKVVPNWRFLDWLRSLWPLSRWIKETIEKHVAVCLSKVLQGPWNERTWQHRYYHHQSLVSCIYIFDIRVVQLFVIDHLFLFLFPFLLSIVIMASFIICWPQVLQPAGGWREGACGMGANQGETGSNLLQCFRVPSMNGSSDTRFKSDILPKTTSLFHLESLLFYTTQHPESRCWKLNIEETSAASPSHQKSYQLRVNLWIVAAVLLPASSYKLNSCQVLVSSIVACGSIWVQRRP